MGGPGGMMLQEGPGGMVPHSSWMMGPSGKMGGSAMGVPGATNMSGPGEMIQPQIGTQPQGMWPQTTQPGSAGMGDGLALGYGGTASGAGVQGGMPPAISSSPPAEDFKWSGTWIAQNGYIQLEV